MTAPRWTVTTRCPNAPSTERLVASRAAGETLATEYRRVLSANVGTIIEVCRDGVPVQGWRRVAKGWLPYPAPSGGPGTDKREKSATLRVRCTPAQLATLTAAGLTGARVLDVLLAMATPASVLGDAAPEIAARVAEKRGRRGAL